MTPRSRKKKNRAELPAPDPAMVRPKPDLDRFTPTPDRGTWGEFFRGMGYFSLAAFALGIAQKVTLPRKKTGIEVIPLDSGIKRLSR